MSHYELYSYLIRNCFIEELLFKILLIVGWAANSVALKAEYLSLMSRKAKHEFLQNPAWQAKTDGSPGLTDWPVQPTW